MELYDEYPIVLKIIWALSFHSTIVQQIQSNRSFMSKLIQISDQSDDVNLRQSLDGIFWNLNSDPMEDWDTQTIPNTSQTPWSEKKVCQLIN